MITIQGLSHRFGSKLVLDNISLTIHRGEIVAIMGSSGGGKTTLLRCLTGLLRPSEGSIEIDGVDALAEPEKVREKMGLVFQNAALFDSLNVFDNIVFGAKRKWRLKRVEQQRLVLQLLKEVGLEGSARLMPSELSGGMRKRVALARALAMKPDLLLYDEPTSGLDPVTAYSIDQLIVQLRDSAGMTSVVVSHDVSSVFRVADRIAFLEKGRLTFVGHPQEFMDSRQMAIRELVEKARAESLSVIADLEPDSAT